MDILQNIKCQMDISVIKFTPIMIHLKVERKNEFIVWVNHIKH